MCEVTTVLGVLGTVAQFVGSRQDAAVETDSIEANRALQGEGLENQAQELAENAAEEKSQVAREAAVLRARSLVAQGEAGLSGVTANRLARDADVQAGLQFTNIDTNLKRNLRQNNVKQRANNLDAANRTASVKRPSAVASGLTIAGTLAESPGVQKAFS